jgi:hypothetical protein
MGRVHGIFCKPYVSSGVRVRLNVQSDNTVAWFMRWSSSSPDFYLTSGGAITSGWNFMAGTHRSSLSQIFLNGSIVASVSAPNGIGDGPVDLGVFNGDDNSLYTNGWGAECSVWQAGLTDNELTALWKGANPLAIRRSALRAYWPLMGGPGNTVPDGTKGHVDLSGFGFHLQTQFGTSDTLFVEDHPPVQPFA